MAACLWPVELWLYGCSEGTESRAWNPLAIRFWLRASAISPWTGAPYAPPGKTLSPAVSVRDLFGPSLQDWLRPHKCSAQSPRFHRAEMSSAAHRRTSTRTRAACSDTAPPLGGPVARHSLAVQELYRRRTPVPPRLRGPATRP